MWHKRSSYVILSLIMMGTILASINSAVAWTEGQIITSSTGTAPTIDGVKDSTWESTSINVSNYDFSSDRGIALYIQHAEKSLYILIEVKFQTTTVQNESISLYFANSSVALNANYTDKKQLTIFGANKQDNSDTSMQFDYYKDNTTNTFVQDFESNGFTGKAKVSNETKTKGYRYYEFQMNFTVSNSTADLPLTVSNKYALQVGYNTTETNEELSKTLIIQLGPIIQTEDDSVSGEFKWDTKLFIQIVLYIVLGFYLIFGVIILMSKKSIDILTPKAKKAMESQDESDEEETEEESEDDK